jgi:hypothetical protein
VMLLAAAEGLRGCQPQLQQTDPLQQTIKADAWT